MSHLFICVGILNIVNGQIFNFNDSDEDNTSTFDMLPTTIQKEETNTRTLFPFPIDLFPDPTTTSSMQSIATITNDSTLPNQPKVGTAPGIDFPSQSIANVNGLYSFLFWLLVPFL
jgi:hypothetical protein